MGKLTIDSKLTIRELIGIRVLLLVFRIAKPFEWQHEIDKYIKELEDLITKKD